MESSENSARFLDLCDDNYFEIASFLPINDKINLIKTSKLFFNNRKIIHLIKNHKSILIKHFIKTSLIAENFPLPFSKKKLTTYTICPNDRNTKLSQLINYENNNLVSNIFNNLQYKFDIVSFNSLLLKNSRLKLNKFPKLNGFDGLRQLIIPNQKISGNLDLRGVKYLKKINISNNKISSISFPEVMPYLNIFNAFNNLLENIYELKAPKLIGVDLAKNKIKNIDLDRFKQLVKIDLSYNKLSALEATYDNDMLITINLSYNSGLEEINIQNQYYLKRIDIRFCPLKKLVLRNLKSLGELNLPIMLKLKIGTIKYIEKCIKIFNSKSDNSFAKTVKKYRKDINNQVVIAL